MPDLRRLLPAPRTARQWTVDAAATLCALVLGTLLLLASLADDPDVRRILGIQIGVGLGAAVLLLLYRRQFPTVLAVLFTPVGLIAPAAAGATLAALCSTAAARRPRIALTVTGAHALLVLLLFWPAASSWHDYAQGVGTFLFLDAVALTSGMLLRSQRRLVGSLKERARQADEEQRLRVEEARHLERERIAREMHDVLAHRISLLAVHAGALEFAAGTQTAQSRAAGIIRECAHEALEDLRDVIRMLRTDGPDGGPAGGADDADRPQPTLADLPGLVEETRRTGIAVAYDGGRADAEAVPPRVGRHAYRIVQEGLTNARKHAPGEPVRVLVDVVSPGTLTVEIANSLHHMPQVDRSAVPPALPGAGVGLIGLRERVALVGGRLEHGHEQGEFRLRAWLPWSP